MKKIIVFLFIGSIAMGQSYPPQANISGTTAIHKNSSLFVNWATSCTVTRGWQDIANTSSGVTSVGTENNALNIADGSIVSLGDGGSAILTFLKPIKNGQGYDFAVFENGFLQQGSNTMAFLELAFVEVSSDGVNYFRFPAVNEYASDFIANTTTQGGSGFANMNASYLHNFAGKYIGSYGTPFNLDDIPDNPSLDKMAITHIKLIDVVGTNNTTYATYDSLNNIVVDPYPTPFASGGFDLDAIGVIHENNSLQQPDFYEVNFSLFPNYVTSIFYVNSETPAEVTVYGLVGNKILTSVSNTAHQINVSHLATGFYMVSVKNATTISFKKIYVK